MIYFNIENIKITVCLIWTDFAGVFAVKNYVQRPCTGVYAILSNT